MNLTLHHKDTLVLDRTEVCCQKFDPNAWDYTQHDWNNKLFLKDSVFPWFSVKAIARMMEIARGAKAIPHNGDAVVLANAAFPFRSELLLAVTKEVPNQETARLSGTFISRVFEAPNNKLSQCERGLNGYLASLGKTATKYYFYYPYCSGCARKYGHNYIVAIAETKPVDPYY